MVAEFDHVTVLQNLPDEQLAIDLRTIVALQVFDDFIGAGDRDAGVSAAEQWVGNANFVAGIASDADAWLLNELLIDNFSVEHQYKLGHSLISAL